MNKKLAILSTAFLMAGAVAAQSVVKGRVTDTQGNPLIGATVRVEGTKQVTITDENGNFELKKVATSSKKVTVSYVGMKALTQNIAGSMVFVLDNSTILDEAVVTSYGSGQKLGSLTGSVAAVSSDEIKNRPVGNVNDALQGKVTGVQIYTSSGEPSASSSIKIRGVGTLSGSSAPLLILDGVSVNSTTIMALNPNDIASVSVLKDASATSIYGARAANGVIIYTTKKGRRNESGKLTLNASYGVSNMANTTLWDNLMNTDELLTFWEQNGMYSPTTIKNIRTKFGMNNTNWREYFYHPNRPTYQANLSYSGGSEKNDYYVAFGVHDEAGLAYRSHYTRYSNKINFNSELKPWLRAGISFTPSLEFRKENPYGENNPLTGIAYMQPPFYTPYDKNGNEYFDQLVPGLNTWSLAYRDHVFRTENNKVQLTGVQYFELMPIKGLRIKTQNSADFFDQVYMYQRLASHKSALGNGLMQENHYRKYQFQTTNTAEYKWNIGVNNFTVLAGQEWMKYNYRELETEVEGLKEDRLMQMQNGTGTKTLKTGRLEYAFQSYFGRVSYDYDNRYFGDFTLRHDESSLLAPAKRKGMFFSIGGRWKMKPEAFLQSVSWIDKLDLRASYGTQGRSEIDPYLFYSLVGATKYQQNQGWVVGRFGNPNLGWERQKQFSVGAELGAFNNRLNVSLEFYNKMNTDLHMDVPYPSVSGTKEVMKNTASVRNTGVEFSVSYEIFDKGDFSLEPYFNVAYNKQKVTKLFPEAYQDGKVWNIERSLQAWIVGEPVQLYMPIWAGVNKKTGEPQWYLPGDDKTKLTMDPTRVTSTYSSNLSQATGKKLNGDVTGGFGIRAGWKGLSLVVDFAFQLNKYLINNDAFFTHNPVVFAGYNMEKDMMNNIWTTSNTNAKYPAINYQSMEFDNRILEDASFLRMKNITLSYALPKSVLASTKVINEASVYVTGRNLLTFTGYKGQDPEVDANLTTGAYPNTKQVAVGLNVTF